MLSIQTALKFTQSGVAFYRLKVMSAFLFNITDFERRGSLDARVSLFNGKSHSSSV